jgi:hypothetical protein
MTATERYLGGEPQPINFATIETFGLNAQKTVALGVNAMWSSNARPDNVLKYTGPNNDRDPILLALPSPSPNAVLTNTYHLADGNLDGMVKYTGANNDRDPILSNVGGTTPTAVRQQRLP